MRCGGCSNQCILTVNTFKGGRKYITGNRCERGAQDEKSTQKGANLAEYKLNRIFAYDSLPENEATRGVIGIPRTLNIYENYPFWATFFKELGFSVMLSPKSTKKIYEMGMDTIPSEHHSDSSELFQLGQTFGLPHLFLCSILARTLLSV